MFEGTVKQPGFYSVQIDATKVKKFISPVVYLPADSIYLTVDVENAISSGKYLHREYTYIRSTSPIQKYLEKYLSMYDSLHNKFLQDKELVVAKFRQTWDSGDKSLMDQWADSVNNFTYRAPDYWSRAADLFIEQHPESEEVFFAMLQNRNDRAATARFRGYLDAMPPERRESLYGQLVDVELKKKEERNANSQRFIGNSITQLAGKSPEGKELDASQVFWQNKLILVEFWASWCGPCRVEMPKYAKLYQEYRPKGFDIIAVSLDTNYNHWVKAIEQDGLPVHHLSELKGSGGEDPLRFKITAIPANLLVDGMGKIVAVDVNPAGLKTRLQQILVAF
jgi:thiol-disulfide isomerase/thioredoxin